MCCAAGLQQRATVQFEELLVLGMSIGLGCYKKPVILSSFSLFNLQGFKFPLFFNLFSNRATTAKTKNPVCPNSFTHACKGVQLQASEVQQAKGQPPRLTVTSHTRHAQPTP